MYKKQLASCLAQQWCLLNKKKFYFLLFLLNSSTWEQTMSFRQIISLNAESHFCSSNKDWTGIGVPT